MFEHKKIQGMEEFFIELKDRREQGVYFYRINGYNEQVMTLFSNTTRQRDSLV